jgi:cell division protein FtsB
MKPVSLEVTMMKRIGELNKEVAALKAEVERLKEGNECLDQMHEKEMARSAFLCEDVNRTTAWGRGLESDLSWARAELLMVKAEVERLTKENEMLTHKVRYWQIEAECDHGRWLRCLEDLEHLRRLK